MKRKPQYRLFERLRYRCPPVTFYLNDIERILEAFRERNFKFSLADSEFDFEHLDELREARGTKIRSLTIVARTDASYKNLVVEFKRGGVHLSSPRGEDFLVLWHQLRDILASKSKWYFKLVSSPYVFSLVAVLTIIKLSPFHIETYIPEAIREPLLPVLAFDIFCLTVIVGNLWQPVIHLKKHHEVESFWQRNGEKIIIAGGSAIAGAVIKQLIDIFFK